MDINIRPLTPQDLEHAGYRIECGGADNAVHVICGSVGKYWWTWTREGYGCTVGLVLRDSADEAVADARQHQEEIAA